MRTLRLPGRWWTPRCSRKPRNSCLLTEGKISMEPKEDGAAAGVSGLEQLRRMIAAGQRPGIAVSLDFTLVEVDAGHAVFQGTPGLHAYNPIGMVHGGY